MKRKFFIYVLLSSFLIAGNIDKQGNTPLHKTIMNKNITVLKELLNKEIEIDQKNYKGETALHLAVKLNNIESVEMLIAHYATISIFDVYNFSPLYYANNLKYYEIANLLKQHGAKIEIRKIDQKSELETFVEKFNNDQ